MGRVSIREKASQQIAARNYSFTVVFEPVGSGCAAAGNGGRKARGNKQEASGYQVTVPLLPGLITYGRTRSEACEMARDAIRCHVNGLLTDFKQTQVRGTLSRSWLKAGS
ncbi:MAG TPA: type II toxin-antitoxin system HicB family antitoxin [Candidatus Eisenbacteria bacterium]|nr:type II toxin-antitoxin system HicB family antitoxin [Candidatus Eisenbacteria bacterium]